MFLAAQQQGGGSMQFLIMMVVIFAIMYFFMIRPQQKKQKEIRNFQNSLQEGSKVVTGGGIYGTIKKVDIATGKIELEIAKGVVITVDKGSVFADVAASATVSKENNETHPEKYIQYSQKLLFQYREQGVPDFFVLPRPERSVLAVVGPERHL